MEALVERAERMRTADRKGDTRPGGRRDGADDRTTELSARFRRLEAALASILAKEGEAAEEGGGRQCAEGRFGIPTCRTSGHVSRYEDKYEAKLSSSSSKRNPSRGAADHQEGGRVPELGRPRRRWQGTLVGLVHDGHPVRTKGLRNGGGSGSGQGIKDL